VRLPETIAVLGSTGSIGRSTLDILERAEEGGSAFRVVALTAGSNVELLVEQARRWRPEVAVLADETGLPDLRTGLEGTGVQVAAGSAAVVEAAERPAAWVMGAIVGSAGLAPAFAAARRGATLALANKESVVCAGPALMAAAQASGGTIIPVDSEHSALFQVLAPEQKARVTRLILTASGGPFRTATLDDMRQVTPQQAAAHPNWSMGLKNSLDSATLMNKGLEMIEAAYLFDTDEAAIDVVVHPQSIIHSLVEYCDGSTLAQLGPPDMRTPIACALAWPDRLPWPAPKLDLAALGSLTFEAPDLQRFPALGLARSALKAGGRAPNVLNAANEVAVAAFVAGRIGFLDIASLVDEVLQRTDGGQNLATTAGDDVIAEALLIDAGSTPGRGGSFDGLRPRGLNRNRHAGHLGRPRLLHRPLSAGPDHGGHDP
jgi:1-deoxy-D-xylulose-5-phosphate reductoisomerase